MACSACFSVKSIIAKLMLLMLYPFMHPFFEFLTLTLKLGQIKTVHVYPTCYADVFLRQLVDICTSKCVRQYLLPDYNGQMAAWVDVQTGKSAHLAAQLDIHRRFLI